MRATTRPHWYIAPGSLDDPATIRLDGMIIAPPGRPPNGPPAHVVVRVTGPNLHRFGDGPAMMLPVDEAQILASETARYARGQ